MVSLRCAFQAALAISVLLAASVASSAEITARRVPGHSPGASRLVQKPGATTLRAEDLKQLQLKKERWQSFPDFMTRPSVDWTPLSARRRGFRGPSGKIERSHRLTATG